MLILPLIMKKMMNRTFCLYVTMLLVCAAPYFKLYGQSATSRPNIVLILVDQMRPDHLSGAHAPNISALAQNGIVFLHAYTASPLCSPSRNSMITGLYPSQTGIYGNQTGPISDDLRDQTFMHRLQQAGYYTALIGKHHYIDRYATGTDMVKTDAVAIKKYGFDAVTQVADISETEPNADHSENADDYIYYLRKHNLDKVYYDNLKDSLKQGRHPLASEFTQDGFIGLSASRFIEGYDRRQPFYLNVSFIGPHPPYEVPASFSKTAPADTKDPIGANAQANAATKRKRAVYTDMITQIDHYIGEIIVSLKKKGLYDNTVFIFTADHGDNLGDFGIWDKRYFYEQSVGVPLFISGHGIPGRNIRVGAVASKSLVSTIDLYPTIMGLAKTATPEHLPGRDLLAMVNGNPANFRNAVYAQLGTLAMVRTAGWKMVFDPEEGGTCYLFNLISDPGELKNLAGEAGYTSTNAELTAKLLAFYIRMYQSTQLKEQLRLQQVRVGE
jgi:arylsulfatase A-like enzyme